MDIKKLVIRPFEDGDREIVNGFFDRLSGEDAFFINCNNRNRKFCLSYFGEKRNENTEYFLAEYNEIAVGILFLMNVNSVPELGVAVDGDYQKNGIGYALMQFAEKHIANRGNGGILLTVHPANVKAQALYRKAKYEYLGVAENGEYLFIRHIKKTADGFLSAE